jgi:N-acetylglutamate synthase-like GNAT family acetyltransferase
MSQQTNTIEYRKAARNEETNMYAVIEEVSAEVPVLLDIEKRKAAMRDIIVECHESGKSWVAIDSTGEVVGCALARPNLHERGAIYLLYIGVRKNSRGKGICTALIDKLKANRAPLTAAVLQKTLRLWGIVCLS